MRYITVKQTAQNWNISEREVLYLLKKGRIADFKRAGRQYLINENTNKPIDKRLKTGLYSKDNNNSLNYLNALAAYDKYNLLTENNQFNQIVDNVNDLLISFCAFNNTNNATIVFEEGYLQDYLSKIEKNFYPINKDDYQLYITKDKRYIILNVYKNNNMDVVLNYQHKIYIRESNRNIILADKNKNQLIHKKSNKYYSLTKLDEESILQLGKYAEIESSDPTTILNRLHLLTFTKDHIYKVNNEIYKLLAKEDKHLKCQFNYEDYVVKSFNNLWQYYRFCIKFIDNHYDDNNQKTILRHLLINSIIHADYLNYTEIKFSIYKNSTIFTNTGSFKNDLSEIKKGHGNYCLNANLQNFFKRVFNYQCNNQLSVLTNELLYHDYIIEFNNTLSENFVEIKMSFENNSFHDKESKYSSYDKALTVQQANVYMLLKQDNNLKISVICHKLYLSRATVCRILAVLKQKGYIERVGSTRGSWLILK